MECILDYRLEREWPPLGWVAECVSSDPRITVRHGSQVEIGESWFCEAIWNGPFPSGDFDRTDLVYGSGGRARDGRLVFVSSAATVDRLQCLRLDGNVYVSNSLACLVSVGGIAIDLSYPRFPKFFRSMVRGIDRYERRLATRTGDVELCYYRNLTWDGRQLVEEDKPFVERDFTSFAAYRGFLDGSMRDIAANMRDAGRRHRYEMVAGLSSGYDSPTVAVLARESGLKRVFSFRTARGGQEDDGAAIAERLGLEVTLADRDGWRRLVCPEAPYLAATGSGVDVNLSAVSELLGGRVFASGFHGGKIWGKDATAVGPDLVRADPSGLAFTEHRLILGSIHFPVPFMGALQIRDVVALGNSAELKPWDVPGRYSRPVCRRIVEEAGVPRVLFGVSKKATATLFHFGEGVLTRGTQQAYYRWLQEERARGNDGGRSLPKPPGPLLRTARWLAALIQQGSRGIATTLPGAAGRWLTAAADEAAAALNRRINLAPHLFPWAIKTMAQQYPSRPAAIVGAERAEPQRR